MKMIRIMNMENDQTLKITVDTIVDSLFNYGVKLFHDQYKEAYMSTDGTGKNVLQLRSRLFEEWIGHYCFESFNKVVNPEIIGKLTNTLAGIALFDKEMIELSIRTNFKEGVLWYDLGVGVVAIGTPGWTVFDDPLVLFKRLQHQKEQVRPIESEDINLLLNYVNLKSDDDKLLFQVYLIAAFIPGFPHPLLILHGPQGSGKTTPLRVLKELIDPSQLQGLSPPTKPDDFVHVASKHYFLFYDNLSSMPGWLSDTLARASTGDGFSKRALYTNDDDIIYNFQRVIAINGINQVVTRSDLLDRSLLLNLERISDGKRIEESIYWEAFNNDKPSMLGAIFTVIAKALELHPKIQLDSFPRMADFYRWGCAITEAMGQPKEKFMQAYEANVNNQHDEAIEASPVALAIISLMNNQESWEGTPTELLNKLNDLIDTPLHARSAGLPQHPNWLSRNLTQLQPDLLAHGITVERLDTARPRKIIVRKELKHTVDTVLMTSSNVENTEKIFGNVEILKDFDDPFKKRQYDNTDSKNQKSLES